MGAIIGGCFLEYTGWRFDSNHQWDRWDGLGSFDIGGK
jgi:hypothetical protein